MLVDRRLAACINILQGCTSVYRWQGLTETASEVPVLIKTTRQRYEAVEQAIKSLHPYELPRLLLSLSITDCLLIYSGLLTKQPKQILNRDSQCAG